MAERKELNSPFSKKSKRCRLSVDDDSHEVEIVFGIICYNLFTFVEVICRYVEHVLYLLYMFM